MAAKHARRDWVLQVAPRRKGLQVGGPADCSARLPTIHRGRAACSGATP